MAADRSGREQEEPVKVVDRRLFDSEGNRRDPDREAPAVDATRPAEAPRAAEPERRLEASPPRPAPPGGTSAVDFAGSVADPAPAGLRPSATASGLDFTEFVMSMAANGFMALGEIPHPATGAPALDLEAARELIDILGMLQEKTKGNLSPQEAQALEANLYELRMRYVERAKGGAGA